MKIFKVNKSVDVVCDSQNTRHGFRHVATYMLNGQERDSVKINYLNRAWETYEFESVLTKLMNDLINTNRIDSKAVRQFKKMIAIGRD